MRNLDLIPEEIIKKAEEAELDLLPSKSKDRYQNELETLEAWMLRKQVNVVNEIVLLAYFNEKSKMYKSSSLWSKYSMIKKMLMVKKGIDISSYNKLVIFLKNKSVGHVAKKAMVLSKENVIKFLTEAPDDVYLMIKVALVFGVYGACRRDELANISIHDVEDRGSVVVVTIPKTKTNKKRAFTIIDDDVIPGTLLYRKYAMLRPRNVEHRRFFLQYKKNSCTVQPVGKNSFGGIPKIIAKYLHLPNAERYTGHTFRRTSAALLGDNGADTSCAKRQGGWKSTSEVTEEYFEDSIESKDNITLITIDTEEKAGISYATVSPPERGVEERHY